MGEPAPGVLARASVMLANASDAADAIQLAGAVEEHGFARIWLAENNGLEAASMGGALACATSLEIGTAVVPVYNRSPVLLAMMAATWSSLTNRPVHLGIGAGGQVLVADWHGREFAKPRAAVEETIQIVRQVLSGERTCVEGTIQRSTGFRSATAVAAPVKLYIGGMGPQMTRLAARQADGLILTWIPADEVGRYRSVLDEATSDRRADGPARLLARVYAAVGDDVADVRERVREEMVEYVLSPPYARYFSSIGHAPEVDAVRRGYERRDRKAAVAGISDDLLDRVLVTGTSAAEIAPRLQEYYRAGADEIIVQPVPRARGGEPERTIRVVAEALGRLAS